MALALAACVDEPRYPVRLEQTPPPTPPPQPAPEPLPPAPPPPPRDPDAPQAAPSTPVQSTPLPPIGRAAPRSTPPYGNVQSPSPPARVAADAGGAASRPTPPYGEAQPPPTARTAAASQPPSPWVQPAPVAETPGQVTVGRNETLFDVAERVRTPVRALIEVNGLQPPYNLAPGTVLKVPPPLFYTVNDGDTLFGIARRFNMDPRSLANLNNIQLETPIRRGQRIALPSLARDQGANGQADGTSPPGVAPPASTVARASPDYPRTPRAVATATTTAPPIGATAASPPLPAQPSSSAASSDSAIAVAPNDAQVAAVGKGRFSWPVKGDVISGFGPKGPGQRNDGMNIAATAGDSVHAAAAGEVVFAGDLPGFGNLVLLKHPGGFVTAYAHLSKIDVKMRDTVAQGQEVGLAGQTGPVDRPQVHFEIRYAANPRDKARPVDPSLLLPGAG